MNRLNKRKERLLNEIADRVSGLLIKEQSEFFKAKTIYHDDVEAILEDKSTSDQEKYSQLAQYIIRATGNRPKPEDVARLIGTYRSHSSKDGKDKAIDLIIIHINTLGIQSKKYHRDLHDLIEDGFKKSKSNMPIGLDVNTYLVDYFGDAIDGKTVASMLTSYQASGSDLEELDKLINTLIMYSHRRKKK